MPSAVSRSSRPNKERGASEPEPFADRSRGDEDADDEDDEMGGAAKEARCDRSGSLSSDDIEIIDDDMRSNVLPSGRDEPVTVGIGIGIGIGAVFFSLVSALSFSSIIMLVSLLS